MIPTMNLSVFSGTLVSGALIIAPAAITSIPAIVAPIAAEAIPLPEVLVMLLPKVMTINATSSPSSSTDL